MSGFANEWNGGREGKYCGCGGSGLSSWMAGVLKQGRQTSEEPEVDQEFRSHVLNMAIS